MRKSLIIIISLISIIFLIPVSGSPHGVKKISYSPETVYSGSEITISITFEDITNISSVGSFYCRIAPDYLCHIPSLTLSPEENTFSTSFKISENSSQTIGFDIFVKYDNGEKITFPGEDKLDFGMAVAEPISKAYYYQIDISDVSTPKKTSDTSVIEKTPVINILPVVIMIPIIKKLKMYVNGKL